jgi:hypothetical protein
MSRRAYAHVDGGNLAPYADETNLDEHVALVPDSDGGQFGRPLVADHGAGEDE